MNITKQDDTWWQNYGCQPTRCDELTTGKKIITNSAAKPEPELSPEIDGYLYMALRRCRRQHRRINQCAWSTIIILKLPVRHKVMEALPLKKRRTARTWCSESQNICVVTSHTDVYLLDDASECVSNCARLCPDVTSDRCHLSSIKMRPWYAALVTLTTDDSLQTSWIIHSVCDPSQLWF